MGCEAEDCRARALEIGERLGSKGSYFGGVWEVLALAISKDL